MSSGSDPEKQLGAEDGPAPATEHHGADEQPPSAAAQGERSLFDPPFAALAPPWIFWQDALLLGLLGGALGAFGYAYLKAISEFTDLWITAGSPGYPGSPASLHFGGGRAWWIGVCAGGGAAVGLARWVLRLETAPSFIDELRSLHVEVVVACKSALVTLLSLLAGVPMGPEAGLGASAGVAGTLLARLRPFRQQADDRRRLYVLSAMCSAFATVLPNPLVSVLMTLELGRPLGATQLPAMHVVATLGIGATASFLVYCACAGGYTYFSPAAFVESLTSGLGLDSFYVVEALLFGAMGAAMGLVYVLLAGLAKAAAAAMRARLDAVVGRWPRVVLLSAAGGAAVGALGWGMPLVLTDGQATLSTIMSQPAAVGSSVLAASAFAKMLGYHLAKELGFSGGLFLPMLSMSTCLGAVFVNVTAVNSVVALSCSTAALGAALIPAPFMFSLLANSLLLVGPQGLTPLFVTAFSAHLFCLGIGLPQRLLARAAQGKVAAASQQAEGQL